VRLFINLTPLIPLSLKRRGGEILERGFAPLLPTLPLPLLREGGQGDRLLNELKLFVLSFPRVSPIISSSGALRIVKRWVVG